jgi:hypothetical protein
MRRPLSPKPGVWQRAWRPWPLAGLRFKPTSGVMQLVILMQARGALCPCAFAPGCKVR